MHLATTRLAVCLALLCSACAAPSLSLSTGAPRAWSDPSWLPGSGGHGALTCDRFGRCWRLGASDRFARDYMERPDTQPPGWAESLPRSARAEDRFLHPRGDLVCDRATRICYKDGKIDKSDTERVFSGRAADRADDLRDRHGTGRLFAPERGVACDRERRICLEDGDPDRGLTRRYFGPRAARTIDEGRPRDDDARGVERRSKRKRPLHQRS